MWLLGLSSANWYRHTALILHKECHMPMCVNPNRDVKVIYYDVPIYLTYVIPHTIKRNTFKNNNTKFLKLLLFIVSFARNIISVNKSRIRIMNHVARMGQTKRQWLQNMILIAWREKPL
jgi:hypothetical protein